MKLSGVHSNLSNDELDAMYADAFASYDNASGAEKVTWAYALQPLGSEINERLRNPLAFVGGFFGYTKFPKFDAIQRNHPEMGGFVQTQAAQESVDYRADEIGSDIKTGLALGVSGYVGAAALGLIVLLLIKK